MDLKGKKKQCEVQAFGQEHEWSFFKGSFIYFLLQNEKKKWNEVKHFVSMYEATLDTCIAILDSVYQLIR